MKRRGFELIHTETDTSLLPKRSTKSSAGYDFKCAEEVTIKPGEIKVVPTHIKSYMQDDEVLMLYDRSSNPRKRGIVLANSVGVIDADYYNNESNEGQIFGQFKNITNKDIIIKRGDRIMQGVFMKYLIADDEDKNFATRVGGFGSTKDR